MAASAVPSSELTQMPPPSPQLQLEPCPYSEAKCTFYIIRDSGVKAIENLMEKRGKFDYILLETTGLADPGLNCYYMSLLLCVC